MENFLCDNPVVIQDVTKFGYKSWVIPFAILCLGWTGTRKAWRKEKVFHAKLIKKNFPGKHELRFPWLGVVLPGLAFLCFSFFILQDRSAKLNALKTREYRTYQGHIEKIHVIDRGRTSYAKGRVQFKIIGHGIESDGRRLELNRYTNRVTTKNAIVADWGDGCSHYTGCGLSIGDKVRIKQVPVDNIYSGGDTLSIEKCEMP